jgi:pentatricopeptide repeat protein
MYRNNSYDVVLTLFFLQMFAKTHRVERAFDMFHLMKAEKIEPDLNTYIGLVVGSFA